MDKIKCPNCGTDLILDEMYDDLYEDGYHTERCYYHCPQCKKDYYVDLHYKYVDYSIEEVD